jgi:hypothetical protein
MRVRQLLREKKELQGDTNWKIEDLTHKNAPLFPKTTPIRSGWQWRSAKAIGQNGEYVLLAKCNPKRDNWQAILMRLADDGSASAVGRFEYHGSHPGLHAHAHCQRSGIESGPSSLDDLIRCPNAGSGAYHRRNNAWTEESFWEAAKRFFRVQ